MGRWSGELAAPKLSSSEIARPGVAQRHGGAESAARRVRVVIADDHPLYRDALRRTIEACPQLELAAMASDGREALDLIIRHSPEVAVLDIRMRELDGKDVASRLRERASSTRVLFVSEHHGGELVLQALTAGGTGYLSKTATGEEICAAIERVARGEAVLPSEIGGELASTLYARGPAAARLSERELSILQLIADGNTARTIAERLHVAVPTVKTHIQNLYSKLGVSDRGAAVAEAMRRGLVE
jgi:two-component system, NarL family, nitrate/nitrite response regulator NarL